MIIHVSSSAHNGAVGKNICNCFRKETNSLSTAISVSVRGNAQAQRDIAIYP